MARHRSPQGRRTHLGLPLPLLAAAAGAGVHAAAPAPGLSLAPRVVATVLAGGALAAAGQAALDRSLPLATDATATLTTSVHDLLDTSDTGAGASSAPLSAVVPPIGAVAAEPRPVDVSGLVKAAERHGRAATRAAAPQVAASAPETAAPGTPATEVAAPGTTGTAAPGGRTAAAVSPAGVVQMVAGQVTSGFGTRWGRLHRGLDIAAPVGTPIRVPLAGDVIAAGPASGFGLWVRVRHDDGTVTTYGHVNRALVHVGERVAAGEEIAEVGNRGHSTGPHLHVEVETPAGTTINPRPWLDARGVGY